MPRSAAETPISGTAAMPLDALIDRGRAQGHLSLDEVRQAFKNAGISPAQGRSILRELSEAGIELASRNETGSGTGARRGRRAHGATAAPSRPATRRGSRQAAHPPVQEQRQEPAGQDLPPGAATPAAPTEEELAELETDIGLEIDARAAAAEGTAERTGAEQDGDDGDVDLGARSDLDDNTSVMGDSVHTYLKAIGRRHLLTAEQEVELAKRIEAGLYAEYKLENEQGLTAEQREALGWVAEDGRQAKAHMLEANLRLVVSVAKKYADRGLPLLDVVQEGNLGLIRAVEKFDYAKGYKFSTYAMWWIRQAIQRGFADSARTIRLPVHVLEMLSKLNRIERDMHQRMGREPTPEELAAELGKSKQVVLELLRTSRQPISLDSTIGDEGETRIGDLIEDTDSPEASELVDRQLMADQLRRTLGVLSPREEMIMALRFGLYDGTPRTLDEIGKQLGLTRERIRQLEKESLSKLRHPSNAHPLLDFAV